MPEPTLSELIKQAADNPRKVAADGLNVEQHSIDDLIKADRYLAAKTTAAAGRLGIQTRKINPPGSV